MAKKEEILKLKNDIKEFPRVKKEGEEEKVYKTRKEHYEETGEIKIYPTELSFSYNVDGTEIIQGSCLKSMFFSFHGVEETDPIETVMLETFELGYAMESIIKKELKLIGMLTEENEEYEIKQVIGQEGALLSGRCDAKLNDGTLVEMKSYKHHEYTAQLLEGTNDKKGILMESHICQAASYLAAEKYKGVENPKLIMWYKDRNQLKDILLDVTLDDYGDLYCNGEKIVKFNFASVLDRADKFAKAIKENKIPKRDYGYYDKKDSQFLYDTKQINFKTMRKINNDEKVAPFKCNYCRYKTLCLNSED